MNKKGKQYQGVKTSRYASSELVHFKKQCQSFYNLNFKTINAISAQVKEWIALGLTIQMDTFVALENSRVWTLENTPKQIDRDNFLKGTQDALCEILGIDDKHIFTGLIEKVTCETKDQEQTLIKLSAFKPRTLNEIMKTKG